MAGENEKSSALEKAVELPVGRAKNDNYVPSQLTKKKKRKRRLLHL